MTNLLTTSFSPALFQEFPGKADTSPGVLAHEGLRLPHGLGGRSNSHLLILQDKDHFIARFDTERRPELCWEHHPAPVTDSCPNFTHMAIIT